LKKPFTTVLAIITTTPVSIPGIGPSRIAAEIVGVGRPQCGRPRLVVQRPLVGRDEVCGQHKRHHHNDFGKHPRGLRPNPCRYAIAHAALDPISTANSSHPTAGWSSSPLIAIWKPSA